MPCLLKGSEGEEVDDPTYKAVHLTQQAFAKQQRRCCARNQLLAVRDHHHILAQRLHQAFVQACRCTRKAARPNKTPE